MAERRDAPALVVELTLAVPSERLEARQLSALNAAVRSDEAALRAAYAALTTRLRVNDARTRLRAALLADHLFRRSKLFRTLLASWLPEFVAATVGSVGDRPLPPPRAAASRLQELAPKLLQQWHAGWGEHYPQLAVALHRTADARAPALRDAAAAAEAEQARREARTRELQRQRYWAYRPSVDGVFAAARLVLAQLDRSMALLFPPAEAGEAAPAAVPAQQAAASEDAEWEEVLAPPLFSAPRSEKAALAEDATVSESLRGVLVDLRARVPTLAKAVSELSCAAVDDAQRSSLLQEALALKNAVEVALQRYGAHLHQA